MEVVDDFRILFDFMLPLILLYGPERQQYKRLRENATVNSHTESDIKLKQEVTFLLITRVWLRILIGHIGAKNSLDFYL